MRQAAACCFSASRCLLLLGQPLRSHSTAPRSRRVLPTPAPDRRHAAQAAQAGAGASGRACRRRESVTFVVPGRDDPSSTERLRASHITQRTLSSLLDKTGAVGFELPDGSFSDQLGDLPEGGTVQLVMPHQPSTAEQLRSMHQPCDKATQATEQEFGAFLRQRASSENAGCATTALQTGPYKDARGQNFVQFGAAVVARDMLYLGELQRTLGEHSVTSTLLKYTRISAESREASPELAAALRGVSHVKLFLAGERVREGLSAEELAKLAAAVGIGLAALRPGPGPCGRPLRQAAVACVVCARLRATVAGLTNLAAVRQHAAGQRAHSLCPAGAGGSAAEGGSPAAPFTRWT